MNTDGNESACSGRDTQAVPKQQQKKRRQHGMGHDRPVVQDGQKGQIEVRDPEKQVAAQKEQDEARGFRERPIKSLDIQSKILQFASHSSLGP